MSDEHFTVHATLIKAWAGQKSLKKKDEIEPSALPDDPSNPTVNFHGEKRSNQTHASPTDPEARPYRKSQRGEVKLAYLGYVMMENRNELLVDAVVTEAHSTAGRDAAFVMAARIRRETGDARGGQELRHAADGTRVAADGGQASCGSE